MKKQVKKLINKFEVKTKLRSGDEVIVVSGKEKGKKGKIERILRKKMAVIISGVNMVKKHRRSRDAQKKPEIVDIEAPIPLSNVMFADPKTGEPTRIGYKIEGSKKVRVAKKSGSVIKDKEKDTKKQKKTKEAQPDTEV